jgi:hypothetical protein
MRRKTNGKNITKGKYMKPPPLVPNIPQRVNVQVVPKKEIGNVETQARGKLMRACAEILEARMAVANCHAIVSASCEAFKKISLIGTNLDREMIAGEPDLERLDALLSRLDEIENAIEAALGSK